MKGVLITFNWLQTIHFVDNYVQSRNLQSFVYAAGQILWDDLPWKLRISNDQLHALMANPSTDVDKERLPRIPALVSTSIGYSDNHVGAVRPCVAMYWLKSLKYFECWDSHVNASTLVFQASLWTVCFSSMMFRYPVAIRKPGSVWNIEPTMSELRNLVSKGWLQYVDYQFYSWGLQRYQWRSRWRETNMNLTPACWPGLANARVTFVAANVSTAVFFSIPTDDRYLIKRPIVK